MFQLFKNLFSQSSKTPFESDFPGYHNPLIMFQQKYGMYIYMLFGYNAQNQRKLLAQDMMPQVAEGWAEKYETSMPEIDNVLRDVDYAIFGKS